MIGGLNLLGGLAVHKTLDQRGRYDLVRTSKANPGSPFELIQWYRDLGITRFYLTDLDARLWQPRQTRLIESLCSEIGQDEYLWLDCRVIATELAPRKDSCPVDFIQRLLHCRNKHPVVKLVLTDSILHEPSALSAVGDSIDPVRLAMSTCLPDQAVAGNEIGFSTKFKGSKSRAAIHPSTDEWFDRGHQVGIRSGFLLGAARVGDRSDIAALQTCQAWSNRFRDWRWVCGAAIQAEHDLDVFHRCGCSSVLVSTTQSANGQLTIG